MQNKSGLEKKARERKVHGDASSISMTCCIQYRQQKERKKIDLTSDWRDLTET